MARLSGLGLKGPHRACRLSAHSFDRRAAARARSPVARKRFGLETAIVKAAGGGRGRRAVVVFCHEETKSGFLAPDFFSPFRHLLCVFSSNWLSVQKLSTSVFAAVSETHIIYGFKDGATRTVMS